MTMVTLTPKQLQYNVDSWFQEHRAGEGCIACGKENLGLGDTIVADLFTKGEVPQGGKKSLPLVQIVCLNCGYIHILRSDVIFGLAGPE
jgi:hypothetical protein